MATASGGRTPWTDAKVVAGIILTLTIPAILTLRSVRVPQAVVPVEVDPSPLGYTRSLSLFVVPVAVLAWWFLRHPEYRFQRQGLRDHPRRPGPPRLPPGHPLRPRLLHLREPGGHAGRRGPRRRRLGPRRGVRLLRPRLPDDAPALHLVRRVLARGLQRPGLPGRGARHRPGHPVPPPVAADRPGPGRRRGRLQVVLLRDARGRARLLPVPGRHGAGAEHVPVPDGVAVHQLAGAELHLSRAPAGVVALGGDVGGAVPVVGLSGPSRCSG